MTITEASDGQRKPYNHAYLQTYPPYATVSTKRKFDPCLNIQLLFFYLLQLHAQRYASPPVIIEVTRFPSSSSTAASIWNPQPYLSVALLAIIGRTLSLSLLYRKGEKPKRAWGWETEIMCPSRWEVCMETLAEIQQLSCFSTACNMAEWGWNKIFKHKLLPGNYHKCPKAAIVSNPGPITRRLKNYTISTAGRPYA